MTCQRPWFDVKKRCPLNGGCIDSRELSALVGLYTRVLDIACKHNTIPNTSDVIEIVAYRALILIGNKFHQ